MQNGLGGKEKREIIILGSTTNVVGNLLVLGYRPHATGFTLLEACGLNLVANQIHNIRGRI
jgi:hypothetical protein